LLLVLLIGLLWLAISMPWQFWSLFDYWYPPMGENLPTTRMFENATNFSYYVEPHVFGSYAYEFDISLEHFLKTCRTYNWEVVPIEIVPNLFDLKTGRIPRYHGLNPDHKENCLDLNRGLKCTCSYTSANEGFYFDGRGRSHGGISVLYDTATGRCYIFESIL
jgi:hypothetical protein